MDDHFAVRGEEGRDLRLVAEGDGPHRRINDHDQELMRVLWQLGVLRRSQIVTVERGAIGQVSRRDKGRCPWIGPVLVSLGELDDHRLGGCAGQWIFPQVRRVRHGPADHLDPLTVGERFWDRAGAGYGVDHRRLDDLAGPIGQTLRGRPSRSGRFSLNWGPATGTPSMLTIPGELISEGVRDARPPPISADRRPVVLVKSRGVPPGTLSTPACTSGSTARKMVPFSPPKELPKK